MPLFAANLSLMFTEVPFLDRFKAARDAGFDAVEVLSGTGYLISEFLSPLTNLRTDEYGGSYDNRMRFGREVMQQIKAVTGSDYPLIVRMNGNDFMPGGQGRKELAVYAQVLAEVGVDPTPIKELWDSEVFYVTDPEGTRLEFWS